MSPEYCFAVHSPPVLLRMNVKTPMAVALCAESENPKLDVEVTQRGVTAIWLNEWFMYGFVEP